MTERHSMNNVDNLHLHIDSEGNETLYSGDPVGGGEKVEVKSQGWAATPIEPKGAQAVLDGKYYLRLMYHEFWYGSFDDAKAVGEFCKSMDKKDPYWDYDSFTIEVVKDGKLEWAGREFTDKALAYRNN